MPPSSKGGGGTPPSDVPGSEVSGEAEPIGSLAAYQISTPTFRREGPQSWEEWQTGIAGPASPKKRKASIDLAASTANGALLHTIENAVAKALRSFVMPTTKNSCPEDLQSLRSEMKDNINKAQMQLTQLVKNAMIEMQVEADRRAESMLQRVVQTLDYRQTKTDNGAQLSSAAAAAPRCAMQAPGQQKQHQPAQRPHQTWATVAGTAAQTTPGWTTVTNRKQKLKKHPLDQRRVLFARTVQSHSCDPRDITFEVNKALAHAGANVTVRLIKLKYTEKGNLSGLVRENSCAEDLLEYAPAVMMAIQKLDPAVINIEKTEKWRKLRIHGVALDRYMTEGGLDLAQEEIELMTGSQLPYAPRWIKGDTLGERFDSGTIKRSTLVLTVKSKQAADAILAKGLSFGGRRHEAERF